MTLGQNIKALRKKRCMTMQQLADKLHVSVRTLTRYECDGSYPAIETILDISQIFQVSLDDLFENELDNATRCALCGNTVVSVYNDYNGEFYCEKCFDRMTAKALVQRSEGMKVWKE